MSRAVSPSTNKVVRCGPARLRLEPGTVEFFYAARHREQKPREPKKRGPKLYSDEELVEKIRQILSHPVFTVEGYRKSGLACAIRVSVPARIVCCDCSGKIICSLRHAWLHRLVAIRTRHNHYRGAQSDVGHGRN